VVAAKTIEQHLEPAVAASSAAIHSAAVVTAGA